MCRGADDRRERTILIQRERTHRAQHGALIAHPPQHITDDGQWLHMIPFGDHPDDVEHHVDAVVATFRVGFS